MSKKISIRLRDDVAQDVGELAKLIGGRQSKVINWILRDWMSSNQKVLEHYEKKNKTTDSVQE